jgi:hypothetical protein
MKPSEQSTALVEAIFDNELSLETALALHLEDASDLNPIFAAICYSNLGQLDRVIDLPGNPTVSEVMEQRQLGPFAPLVNDQSLDRHDEVRFPFGTLVVFDGDICKVIGRRRTTLLALPADNAFELFLESQDGQPMYFVGESMVTEIEDVG